MAFNGSSDTKRLCTGTEMDASSRSHGGNASEEPRRKRGGENTRPNHILLLTVFNPVYPITVDVLHTICQNHGQVQRIVIFKKNGVQAMVEFESLESATRAKEALHNADIYSGCCTLKIDFAKPEKLNIHKNDQESWDYTVTVPKESPNNGRSVPLLQEPHFGGRPQPFSKYSNSFAQDRYEDNYAPPYPDNFGGHDGGFGGRGGLMKEPQGGPRGGGMGGGFGPVPSGSVMMVYGLDPKAHNTDNVFNLMCLYGNVARIKFLKTKEGTAMVQMGDSVSVERCIMHLNNIPIGDNKLQVAFSKQNFLSEVANPFPLFDKTPSFKEFAGNKNNRFLNVAQASKNRIQPPSKILHFFNTPPNVEESTLMNVFNDYNVTPPTAVKMFPQKSERSSSGLLEFNSVSDAVRGIMACNHAAIENTGTKFPFLMKLCFSSARNVANNSYQDSDIDQLD